jgi:hypothetical protein
MPLTKEERAQRAREREAERQRAEQQFPGAILFANPRKHDQFCNLHLEAGNPDWLEIRVRGDSWWSADHIGGKEYPDIRTASISLRDLHQLGRFIRALIARYNALIRDVNRVVSETPAIELAENFEPQKNGDHQAAAPALTEPKPVDSA